MMDRIGRVSRWLLFLSYALTAPKTADADLLYFKRGGAVQLPCKRDGPRLILDAPGGPVAFESDDFRAILPGGDPASEWPARLAEARGDGSDRLLAAAWWALENGLTPESTATLRSIHASDPKHEPTASLVRTLDSITPPLPDRASGDLPDALGGTFRTARSPHFVLHHQLDDPQASTRLDVLERVYTSFYLTFAGQGIVLDRPRHRLAAVVFARQADYVAFLKRENAAAFATTQGFYHPARGVVFAFDPRDLPMIRSRREALGARRPDRDSSRLALLLELERLAIGLGVASHEAIHQLVADSGLAPRHVAFPTWLHEGLAAQFEVIRGGRWAGVGRSNDLRLPDWRSIRPAPHLARLVRDEGFGQGYSRDLYAEAWSLVYFLRKAHPAEFTRFLDLLRSPSPDSQDESRSLRLFRTCFGDDLSVLEGEWHLFLRSVTTPLKVSPASKSARPPQIEASRD